MNVIDGILSTLKDLQKQINRIKVQSKSGWVYLTAPLTSASWDGDSYSTTAKTLIDMSAVFAVPAGVVAVLAKTAINDSASAAGSYFLMLSPNNTAGEGMAIRANFVSNDKIQEDQFVIPCNTDGDIYYQIAASGASTMDIIIQIWGYLV